MPFTSAATYIISVGPDEPLGFRSLWAGEAGVTPLVGGNAGAEPRCPLQILAVPPAHAVHVWDETFKCMQLLPTLLLLLLSLK